MEKFNPEVSNPGTGVRLGAKGRLRFRSSTILTGRLCFEPSAERGVVRPRNPVLVERMPGKDGALVAKLEHLQEPRRVQWAAVEAAALEHGRSRRSKPSTHADRIMPIRIFQKLS